MDTKFEKLTGKISMLKNDLSKKSHLQVALLVGVKAIHNEFENRPIDKAVDGYADINYALLLVELAEKNARRMEKTIYDIHDAEETLKNI